LLVAYRRTPEQSPPLAGCGTRSLRHSAALVLKPQPAITIVRKVNFYEPDASSSSPRSRGQLPPVPLTLEGYATLHQMMRLRWTAWRALPDDARSEIASEARNSWPQWKPTPTVNPPCFVARHKGDLMLVHFRNSFDQLNQAELDVARLRLNDFLEPATSYLSVIELGLYESTLKTYKALAERGVEPHSDEWKSAIADTIARQKEAMKPRLFPTMPPNRYVCFYPMDRRRGEDKNWYTLPMEERQRQMSEHGLVGRRYAGEVKQIITGSIGFDDWEWASTSSPTILWCSRN